jgi:hypothetical protein
MKTLTLFQAAALVALAVAGAYAGSTEETACAYTGTGYSCQR